MRLNALPASVSLLPCLLSIRVLVFRHYINLSNSWIYYGNLQGNNNTWGREDHVFCNPLIYLKGTEIHLSL